MNSEELETQVEVKMAPKFKLTRGCLEKMET